MLDVVNGLVLVTKSRVGGDGGGRGRGGGSRSGMVREGTSRRRRR